jgi:hypothetical protein
MRRQLRLQLYAFIATTYAATTLLDVPFRALAAEAPVTHIRVNVGGDTTKDALGNVWEGDDTNKYYNTGNVVWACPKAISNTDNDGVYCSYRWFNQIETPYRYTFPQMKEGAYVVRLHFAELYVIYVLVLPYIHISFRYSTHIHICTTIIMPDFSKQSIDVFLMFMLTDH